MFQKSTKLKWVLSSMLIYGMAIVQAIACNTTPIGCSGFRTQTQGGWGANCSGNNPASILQNNFSTVFPTGVEIGCTNKLKFTSATAVRNYLPQGGTACALSSGIKTNPTSGGGVFGGQLLALAINLKMDLVLANFGSSPGNLKDLIITSGNFKNWTVQQFFDEANKKIGNCSATNFTFSQYSDAAAKINENYDNGSVNKGYLNCPPIVASGSVTHVSCKCGNNGAITLTVSGGFPPYTFKWNNGSTSQNRTGLTAGSYSVTIKDKINQSISLNFTVNQPSAALLASTIGGVTNVSVHGGSNGKVILNVSGGTAPYTYLWSNGATTKDLNNVPAGIYNVTVTDARGCKTTASACVKQPDPVINCNLSASVAGGITDATCFGSSNGAIDLTITGGTAPFTYLWSNGANVQDISNLPTGTYTVLVKDKNNCSATATAFVSQPEPLTPVATSTDATCNGGSTGSITVNVTGGTAPYYFSWSNGSNSEDLNNVPAGTYSVVVTDSKGCSKTESSVVGQPDPMVVTLGSVVNATCNGGTTGSISIASVTGGNGTYSFLWSNGATSQDLQNVGAGAYSVVVTDLKGCTANSGGTIVEPSAIVITGDVSASTTCVCNGTANASAIGGTGNLTYSWSNGASGANLTGVCPTSSLTVTVTDGNGCSATKDLGPVTFKQGCNAVEVVSFWQGKKYDGTNVDAARSNPNSMKGAPEKTNVLGTFFGLGFGGWVILRVDGSIVDKPGADLRIVETTWHEWNCNRYTEKAHIEVSQDMITWYDKGVICQSGLIDIAPLPCIAYVRITDVSPIENFATEFPIADGYDVDGIECVQPTNARFATQTGVSEEPKVMPKSLSVYPNPSHGNVTLSLTGATKGQSLAVSVIDHTGREVKTFKATATGLSQNINMSGETLEAGLYLIRVKGDGINLTQKMLKK